MKFPVLLGAALMLLAQTTQAAWPDKPVRVIVPFPAGGAADNSMRVVARKLNEYWGQAVVVDNRPGFPGIQAGTTAAPDGYTLLLAAGSSIVTAPLIVAKLPYNPQRDLVPVGRVLTNPPIMVANTTLGVKNVKDLIALAKAKPGTLNFSSSGIGSPNHLAMEMFMAMTGTNMVHVPYKGGAPSVTELISNEVQLGINAVPSVLQYVKTGKLTAIGMASATRATALPDVPTVAESGVPGFDYTIWYGLFAPVKTPADVVNRINADLQRALKDGEVARQLIAQGSEPAGNTPQEFARYISEDTAKWARIVKERKLKVEE